MQQAWKQLSAWTAEGHLRPIVGHVLPMTQAAEAYKLLLERKNFGKVVLKID
jgi:NADPH2:quinone reductase